MAPGKALGLELGCKRCGGRHESCVVSRAGHPVMMFIPWDGATTQQVWDNTTQWSVRSKSFGEGAWGQAGEKDRSTGRGK